MPKKSVIKFTVFASLLPAVALADGGSFGGVGASIGMFMFFFGLIAIFLGVIMLIPKSLRKAGGYTMLGGLVLMLVGFGVCTVSAS